MAELSAPTEAVAPLDDTWRMTVASLTRPYQVTAWMLVLMFLVPVYLPIARVARDRVPYAPSVHLDELMSLQPGWALVYGPLYLFLILLPILVVHQQEHIRRTFLAYVSVWVVSYVCFLIYPTVAPRPLEVRGDGFVMWGLRSLYSADPPFNCFPSIHVAHSFVSALTCHRVHRRLGWVAIACASLVAVSTVYTKQHYVVDVVAGALLAGGAYSLFVHDYARTNTSEHERRVAPMLAAVTAAVVALLVGCTYIAYLCGVEI